VNSVAAKSGFFKRLRKLTPLRAAWTFIVGMGSGTADTLADFVRLFSDLTGEHICYKPFHDRLSNASFPEFLRRLCETFMSELIGPTLHVRRGALKAFDDIWIQDGTSFALNDRLAKHFPGRFTRISPAAAEVHCTYSLLEGQVIGVAVAPDSQAERDFLPNPQEVSGKLLLLDRGYVSYSYFDALDTHDAHYICRAKDKYISPEIVECYEGFARPSSIAGRTLGNVRLPKKTVDLIVVGKRKGGKWQKRGGNCRLRLVIFWVAKAKKHVYLFTNLARRDFSPSAVASAYRLRWQIELFFKECKSYTKLTTFQTANPHIAEGLIWASLIAVLFRRYLTYEAHAGAGSRSAPFIAGSVGWMFLRELGRSAMSGYRRFRRALAEALALLRKVATRTNPARRTVFEELGIEPVPCS
jgi:hypothetical protein